MKYLLIIFFIITFTPSKSQAEGLYEYIDRKQAEKKKSRWTLADWMATKERNGWMDQWLALNTAPNFLDFNISVGGGKLTPTIDDVQAVDEKTVEGSLGLHFNIIGLEGQYKESEGHHKSRTGIFHLRIMGQSTQSTFIAVQYGIHLLTDDTYGKYDYDFLGVYANFYFLPYFGATGGYRNYLTTINDSLGIKSDGRRVDAGAFIELGALRLYGNYYLEVLEFRGTNPGISGGKDKREETGITYGLQLFF